MTGEPYIFSFNVQVYTRVSKKDVPNFGTCTQYPVPYTQYPVPSTQYPEPCTQYPVTST